MAPINWKSLLRSVFRIILFPIFIVQVILFTLLGCIPSVFACIYLYGRRHKYRSTDEWQPAEAGPKLAGVPPVALKQVQYSNLYFKLKDGTRLAIDVWLPPKATGPNAAKVGCILHQARYFRSAKLWFPLALYRGFRPFNIINDEYFQAMLARGLAIVSMDIRGTGASFGSNDGPWLEVEVADTLEVLDWIVAQSWSNGKVGTWGISYEGTAALLTGMSGHPAVRAVCPMYCFLDVYSDVGFMGGLHLSGFLHRWEKITHALDDNDVDRLVPVAFFSADGVQPVSSAPWTDLKEAVKQHKKNWRVSMDGTAIEYSDDKSAYSGLSPEDNSPYVRVDAWLRRLKAEGKDAVRPPAFYLISGWFDVTAQNAMKLAHHMDGLVDDVQLVIAAWNHGGIQHARFWQGGGTSFKRFRTAQDIADWFSPRLQDVAKDVESGQPVVPVPPPRVRYFTMQEEKWRSPPTFPFHTAEHARTFHLRCEPAAGGKTSGVKGGGGLLPAGPPSEAAKLCLPVNVKKDKVYVGVSRYTAMTEVYLPMSYNMDSSNVSQLRFVSPPLDRPFDVTGFPVCELWVSSSCQDASLFAYLLCIDAKGRPHYVTEGMLRVIARRLVPSQGQEESVRHYPGLPRSTFLRQDAQPLEPNGPPVLATFMLQPTSYQFLPGQRVGLAVGGADSGHFVPIQVPNDRFDLTLHTGPDYPSRILLPSARHDDSQSPPEQEARPATTTTTASTA